MIKRFYLHRGREEGRNLSIDKGVKLSSSILPGKTISPFSLGDDALPFTNETAYPPLHQFLIKSGFFDHFFFNGSFTYSFRFFQNLSSSISLLFNLLYHAKINSRREI